MVTSSTGLQDLPTTSFQLYPNPIINYTTLTFNNDGNTNYTLTIFDMRGRVVRLIQDIVTEKITIQRESLKSGLYLLQLRSEEQIIISDKLIF